MIKNVISIVACLSSGFLLPVQSVQAAMGEASIPLPTTGESSLDAKFYLIIVLGVALIGVVTYLLWKRMGKNGNRNGESFPEKILKEFDKVILIKPQPTDEEKRVLGAFRVKYSQWCRDVGHPDDKSTATTIQIANLAVAWAYVQLRNYVSAWSVVPTEQIITAKSSGAGFGSTNNPVSRKWHLNDAEPALRLELERARILQAISASANGPQLQPRGKRPSELANEAFDGLANPSSPIAVEVEAILSQPNGWNGWNKAVELIYSQLNIAQNGPRAGDLRGLALPVVIALLERTKDLILTGSAPNSLSRLPEIIKEITPSYFSPPTPDEIKLPGLYFQVIRLWEKKNPLVLLPGSLVEIANLGLKRLVGTGKWIPEGKDLRLNIVESRIKSKEYLSLARQIIEDWLVVCKGEDPVNYKLCIDPYADDLLECAKDEPTAWREAFIGEAELESQLRQLSKVDSSNFNKEKIPEPFMGFSALPIAEVCGRWRFVNEANVFTDQGNYGGTSSGEVRKAVYYVFNTASQKEQFKNLKIEVKCDGQLLQKIGSFGHPLTQEEGTGLEPVKVTDEGDLTSYKLPTKTEFTTLFEAMCGIDFSMLSVPHSPEGRAAKVQIYTGTGPAIDIEVKRTASEPVQVASENLYNMAVLVGITCGIDEFTPHFSTHSAQVASLLHELARHMGPRGQEDRGYGARPVGLFEGVVTTDSQCTLLQLALSKEAEARRSQLFPQAVAAKSRYVTEAEEMYNAMPQNIRAAFGRFLDYAFHQKWIGEPAYTKLTFLKKPTGPSVSAVVGPSRKTELDDRPVRVEDGNMQGLANFLRMPIERVRYNLSNMGAVWRKHCESRNEHELAAFLRGLGH